MRKPGGRRSALLLSLSLLTGACASLSGWQTESAGEDFPDGLRILGEVIMVTSREEALSGRGLLKGWPDTLISAGYTESDIVDASGVTVWAYCYGHNGDLVEIELTRTPSGALVGKVIAVYRKSADWAPCRDAYLQLGDAYSVMTTLAGVGPPRANWIECDAEAENDGWIRRPIPGAPASVGPPVSVWVKSPS